MLQTFIVEFDWFVKKWFLVNLSFLKIWALCFLIYYWLVILGVLWLSAIYTLKQFWLASMTKSLKKGIHIKFIGVQTLLLVLGSKIEKDFIAKVLKWASILKATYI